MMQDLPDWVDDLVLRCRGRNCNGYVVANEETELESCEKCGLIHIG